MPIVAYSGLPGDGKSYSAVEHVILPALRKHRTVVTNLALNIEVLKAEIPDADVRFFKTDDLLDKPDSIDRVVPPGSVWVVDEAWGLFPAGVTAKDAPPAFKKMLNEHRHRVDENGNSMQIVLLALDLAGIASYARQLVAETFRMVKLRALGSSKKFRVDVYQGSVAGANPPKTRRIRQIFGSYKPEVYRFYKSHTQSQSSEGGANESTMDGRASLWRSPVMYIGAPLVVLVMGLSIFGVYRFFHPKPKERLPAGLSGPRAYADRRPVRAGGARMKESGAWRISAVMEGGEDPRVYLEDGNRFVSLPIEAYCDKASAGFFVCEFEGQRISNQVRELPRVLPAPSLVGQVLPAAIGP